MPIQVRTCRMHLAFTVTFVACTILCSVTTASAQQPATKIQGYTEVTDGSAATGPDIYRWLQSGGKEVLTEGYNAHVMAVSADGEVAVISRQTSRKATDWQIVLWSKTGGFVDIANLTSKNNGHNFLFLSDDSSVIWVESVSGKKSSFQSRLLRWSKAGGVKELAVIAGVLWPRAVSSDGSVVVGLAREDGHSDHVFRWTEQGGLQDFPPMDNPLSVSADGTVILGIKTDHVIRWTQAGGAQDLGTLKTDAKTIPHPLQASADGATIVGWLGIEAHDNTPATSHAFLWTQAGGVEDFGIMGDRFAHLNGISADGTLVVGSNFNDGNSTTIWFVSPVADLLARKQAALKKEHDKVAAQAEARAKAAALQAEEQAKADAIAIDQQNRYDKAINTGRPIQIYSLAGHLQDEGRPDLAAGLYQTLIDKFPDDPYAAKAVEKEDAARAAAQQQQQQQAQDSAAQTVATNGPSPQVIEACIQQCSATLNSCKADAQTQHDSAVAKGLVGLLSKNAGMVGGAGTDSQNADSAKSACNDDYNSCSAACQ